MGMLDGILSTAKEMGWQVILRDNRKFKFRKLAIEEHSLLEKNSAGDVTRGWAMFYKLLKRYDGYKGVGSAGVVTVCFDRDIIFDPHNQLSAKEKPEKGNKLQKEFVTKIAEAKCYKHEKINPPFYMDKLTLFLGSAIVLLAIIVGIKVALTRGG